MILDFKVVVRKSLTTYSYISVRFLKLVGILVVPVYVMIAPKAISPITLKAYMLLLRSRRRRLQKLWRNSTRS